MTNKKTTTTSKTTKPKTAKNKNKETYEIFTAASTCYILENKTNGKFYALVDNCGIEEFLTFKIHDKFVEIVTNDEFNEHVKEFYEELIIATGNTFKECFFKAVEKKCIPVPFIPTNDIKAKISKE